MQEKELKYQDKKIVYRTGGSGSVMVLVHGFGEDGTVWENQFDALSTNNKLIVPDLPGSGKSSSENEGWSIEDYAIMLKAVLDNEFVSTSIMIGHSMGGYITLAFAEKFPESLSAFGLFHSSAFADTEEKIATREKGIGFINNHGAFEFLKTVIPNLFSPLTREKNPGLVEKQLAKSGNFSKGALVSYYRAMIQRPDRTSVLKNAVIPVLFVMSKDDAAIPISDVLKQCHLPEKSYIHLLQQSGHMGMCEEAEKSTLILEEFSRSIPALSSNPDK